jgi:hypothetical protein
MIAAAVFAALYVTRVPSQTTATGSIAAAAQPLAQPIEAVPAAPAAAEPSAAPSEGTQAEAQALAAPSEASPSAAPEPEEITLAAEPEGRQLAAGSRKSSAGRAQPKPKAVASDKPVKSAKLAPASEAVAAPAADAPPPSLDDVMLADVADTKVSAKAEAAPAEPTVDAKSKAPAGPDTRSIDDLLSGAVADSAAPAAKPSLPESPSRDDVLSAMRAIEGEVRACGASEAEPVTGTANVALTVVGSTGRVKNAEVTGIQGAVGSCIARLARKVTFSPFSRASFSVNYPYRFK